MGAVTVRTPAKINLGLEVGARRPDGYHSVATVYQAVSLYDDVTATASDELSISADGEQAEAVPRDASNLAARAAVLVARRAGVEPRVHLHIRKGIPVAGGMAGGSADGAAALVACDALWRADLGRATLLELAAQLGSDVPFLLLGGTAVGMGRGERLTPALARGQFHWVLAISDEGLSTPAVYRECDRLRDGLVVPEPRVADVLMAALRAGDPVGLGRALSNDLQGAACSLRPRLRQILEAGEEYGALGSIVSGSGPTCAFLVRDADHALDLAVGLTATGVCRTVRRAHGPVPGAKVVAAEAA